MISAVEADVLTQDDYDAVKVDIQPPELQTRKSLEDTQKRNLEIQGGYLSKTTAASESGRNYETERANMDSEDEDEGIPPTKERPDDFLKGSDDDEANDDKDDPESSEDED